jgi:hypothetical protein
MSPDHHARPPDGWRPEVRATTGSDDRLLRADAADAHGARPGAIIWVQIDLGDDDNDHFPDRDERLRMAMARQ